MYIFCNSAIDRVQSPLPMKASQVPSGFMVVFGYLNNSGSDISDISASSKHFLVKELQSFYPDPDC